MGGSWLALKNLASGNYAGGPGEATQGKKEADNKLAHEIAGPEPDSTAAHDLMLEYVKVRLKDPDSIKQFAVVRSQFVNSEVWTGLLNGGTRSVVGWLYCVEYNGKNSYGAYGGLERMAFLLHTQGGALAVIETDRKC